MGTRGCPPGSSVADGFGQNVIGSDLGSSSDQRRLPPVVSMRSTLRLPVRTPGSDETDLLTELGLPGGTRSTVPSVDLSSAEPKDRAGCGTHSAGPRVGLADLFRVPCGATGDL